jgi:hypothetical protein
MANVVVNNRHVYAETFHLAPVNWRPQSGTWEVTSRWACTPGWTWYGGKNDGYAVNWYKSPLWGDQCIDAYGGIMMSPLPGKPGESWRDLNCMFCGDGVNLFSGYTFVVDGWNGAHSRLLRKGKLVAESDDFQFPPHAIAHRLWFNTRIRLHGGNIQIVLSYYDAKAELHTYPLIDWVDPNPLPGGFAGFWTYNNGIMLARAVLAAQSEGQRPIYTVNKAWTTRLSEDAPYPGYPDAGEVAKPILNSDDVAAELGLGGPGNPASWPQSRATAAASMVAILGSGE